ncbi:helix-turn-helix domain-containing protein [Rhodanobacter ginsengiterrae]|uniref:helix-turn-helix domain-containing protein n=1 Tax=Rhodanobacter ginsengiterrae TaxID=2008451 RepID=UPI003CEB1B39
MINAAVAATDGVGETQSRAKRHARVARRWLCHVSVRVTHSFPLLAAGLLATLQQVPGYDVALADESSSAPQLAGGAVHVLITDRRNDLHPQDRRFAGAPGGCLPRPKVILLTNELPLAGCQPARAGDVDICLPMDCPTDDLLAAVRRLGRSALGPLAMAGGQGPLFDQPARGGLAPSVLRRVRSYIEDHLTEGADLDSLARIAGVSCCHFSRAFKRSTGMPAHHYLITRRIAAAIALIRETDRALSDISLEVGFADQSHFSRTFVQLTGLTPGDFRHRSQ